MPIALSPNPDTGCADSVPGARPLTIVHTLSSLQFGGMEQFVVRLAATQARRGHRPFVLAIRGGPLEEALREAGVPVWTSPQGAGRMMRFLKGIGTCARTRPDIVHAHNPTSLHYACGVKLLSRAKLVLTDHGQCAGVERTPKHWETKQVDVLVSVSEDVEGRHKPLFAPAGRYAVIHNGFEFTPPRRSREQVLAELRLPPGPVGIVVARVEPVKDHETLLRALSLLEKAGLPVNLLIAGDGSERGRLEALLPDLGVSPERVRFLGFRTDVADLLGAADFFVLSSLQEGLPLAVLEAMGQQLPVVATSVGGVPELVSHRETGLLCPARSPEALAGALRELLQDPALRRRLGQNGARRVEAGFSFARMADRYETLYRDLLRLK